MRTTTLLAIMAVMVAVIVTFAPKLPAIQDEASIHNADVQTASPVQVAKH
jgi:hypothetical protein